MTLFVSYLIVASVFSAGTLFGAWLATRRHEDWLLQHQPYTKDSAWPSVATINRWRAEGRI